LIIFWLIPIIEQQKAIFRLMAAITEQYQQWVAFEFECQVIAVDVQAVALTYTPKSGEAVTQQFDFIIGGDGAGQGCAAAAGGVGGVPGARHHPGL
jgi:2-polyprenyl-6-methoxyphenol hydroxylase-like FAD-dependent oxidoreductase